MIKATFWNFRFQRAHDLYDWVQIKLDSYLILEEFNLYK